MFIIWLCIMRYIITRNSLTMFSLSKNTLERDKLYAKYIKLAQEAYNLSTTNLELSYQKIFEAEAVVDQMELLN